MNMGFLFIVSAKQLPPNVEWAGVCYKCAHDIYYSVLRAGQEERTIIYTRMDGVELAGAKGGTHLVELWATLA